jgi:hypothetical protein
MSDRAGNILESEDVAVYDCTRQGVSRVRFLRPQWPEEGPRIVLCGVITLVFRPAPVDAI